MAAVTPHQSINTITPPSSSQLEQGMWEYAVPIDHDENAPINPQKHSSYARDSPNTMNPRQPFTSHTNGASTHSLTSQNDGLAPTKNSLRNKPSDLTTNTEQDSLLELYKPQSNGGQRSTSYSSAKSRKNTKQPAKQPVKTPEDDESNWIHRDKLAQIESKELEEAGFRVSRRVSERHDTSLSEKRIRLASPARLENDLEDTDLYDFPPADDSAPKSFIPKPGTTRGPGSRIPIPRSVSSSITQSDKDSSAPGTRSRTGSNGWTSGTADQSPKSQPSSQDSTQDDAKTRSPPATPTKRNGSATALSSDKPSPKTARNPKSGPATRKTSTTRQASNSTKPRTTPPSKVKEDTKRPGTSSGAPRPSTSHRLEGDPPWIASMYKPDPRLPPDQQMLPTHAKRLAQEQWEKEGKTGTVYDRDFRLLNTEQFPENPRLSMVENFETTGNASSSKRDTTEGDAIKTTVLTTKWPLTGSKGLESPRSASSLRPGTSGTDRANGGYKTMPTISPKPQSPAVATPPATAQQTAIRLPEPPQEDEKKQSKGCCGACVVM